MDKESASLFQKYYDQMLRMANSLVLKYPNAIVDAVDVVQQVFIDLTNENVSLKEDKNVESYLMMRIRFTHQKLLRKARTKYRHSLDEKEFDPHITRAENEAWERHLKSTEQRQLFEEIRAISHLLTRSQKEVLVLYLEGHSYDEIARLFNASRKQENHGEAKSRKGSTLVKELFSAIQRELRRNQGERPPLPRRVAPKQRRRYPT